MNETDKTALKRVIYLNPNIPESEKPKAFRMIEHNNDISYLYKLMNVASNKMREVKAEDNLFNNLLSGKRIVLGVF